MINGTALNKLMALFNSHKRKEPYLQEDLIQAPPIENKPWWGLYKLLENQAKFWRIGEIVICIEKSKQNLHISSFNIKNIEKLNTTDKERIEFLQFKTFALPKESEILLRPVLADRPLASKLARSVCIPADKEILLYVSSPVWVQIETVKSSVTLGEYPSFDLSDTWFGHNTIEGELCYAGQTFCSTNLAECPYGPDRIISPMLIKNSSRTTLELDCISVPLPYLTVYSDPSHHLWTEKLKLIRERDDKPEVRVAKGPPQNKIKLHKISNPRINISGSTRIGIKNLLHSLIGYKAL